MPLTTIMAALLRRTRRVLLATTAINIEAVERFDADVRALDLYDVTAIGGLSDPLGVRAAFSFECALLHALAGRFTADIPVPRGQEAAYRRDTAAELTSLILGNCTGDFPDLDRTLTLTPIVVLAEERRIDRRDHTVFGTMRMRATKGRLDVHLLRPRDRFDTHLNPIGAPAGAERPHG